MPPKPPDEPKGGFKKLAAALSRQRDTLVPLAFQFLWEIARFIVAYGGRSSGKSWSIARVLLILGHEAPLRILCCREIQSSIKESAYRLLADQVELLGLSDFYEVTADAIVGKNGTRFFFEGLRFNISRIRSIEGVTTVWVEEAQSVSEMSWETLLPTIRKTGSRFFISFNPTNVDDPVQRRFVDVTPPRTIVRKVSYLDNPFFSAEAEAERVWLEQVDPDAYRHVWLGEPRTVSDAQILRGKFVAQSFEISPTWSGPFHGLDYGYIDPTAAVRCYVDDTSRTLYVSHEFWGLKVDSDVLPNLLESAIPGISRYVIHADSSRPETTSGLQRNGFPHARSVEKWSGSVDDGIAYLRSFSKIVIDPQCKHLLDECGRYSYKLDRLTGLPLPEPLDAHNHVVDALRYSLSPLIRNQPSLGYFSRAALLQNGEPIEMNLRPLHVFAVIATCETPGTGLAAVFCAQNPHTVPSLTVLGHSLVEMHALGDPTWITAVYDRLTELRAECRPMQSTTAVFVEEGPLFAAVEGAISMELLIADGIGNRDLLHVEQRDLRTKDRQPLPTLDDRATELRAAVNTGIAAKLSRTGYSEQSTFRSSTTNHLVAQILGYRPHARDSAQELLAAFLLACLITRG